MAPAESQSRATEEARRAGPPSYPGAPRWVKVLGIVAIGLVLLAVIIVLSGVGGPHGPGRHMPSGDAGGDAPPSGVTGHGAQRP